MQRLVPVVILAVLFIGCSEKPLQRRAEQPSASFYTITPPAPLLYASTSSVPFFTGGQDTVEVPLTDTLSAASMPDTTITEEEKSLILLLETAREHYLQAMQAAAEGDSTASAVEFEEAIKHLNEASYYDDVESNADFNDLTRSVLEDYEKYIATIDSLGPQSSIFALREKINLEIEKVDITNIQIPASLLPKTDVPLTINEYTKRAIAFFMGKGRVHMENWIHRSGKYFPMMSRIFQEEGLPPELMLLSLPESGLNPTARSWAKAVGLWQFMKATGALYGLRSTYWYDERRDFEKATRAAARHMKDLYADLGDWHLVFVAYNAGPGWVRRAIRRTGSTDFWEMRHRLPRETRNYVPQYIAVALIFLRPEAFGFENVQKADSLAYEYVTVDDCVDLELLAECAGTDLATIRDLNPELTQWCTPPNYPGYQLRVPAGASLSFAENYARIPEEKKLDFATHTVRKGETVGAIAKRYGLQTAVIFEVNRMSRKTRLKVGSTLIIPVQSKSVAAIVEVQRKREQEERERALKRREQQRTLAAKSPARTRPQAAAYEPSGRVKLTYKVKKGETIGHIAEWFRVRASNIRNWNDIPYGRHIYAGQTLKIYVPEERAEEFRKIASMDFTQKQQMVRSSGKQSAAAPAERRDRTNWLQHSVKRGESLEKIAAKYDVAIADIRTWNKLKSSRINAGQTLEIYSAANGNGAAEREEAAATAKVRAGNDPTIVTHVVKKGETLGKIASKYSVTIADVRKWNKLNGSRIVVGQKLKIIRQRT